MAPRDNSGAASVDVAKLFYDRAKHYDECHQRLGASMEMVLRIARTIPGSKTYPGDKQKDLSSLRDSMADLVQVNAELEDRKVVCGDMRSSLVRVLQGQEEPRNEVDTYRQQIDARKERWAGRDSSVVLEDSNVRELDELNRNIAGGDDDDVLCGVAETVSKCPFARTELVEPVRNKTCGHVYSTRGAIAYLVGSSHSRGMPTSLEMVDKSISKRCCQAACHMQVSAATLERDFATEASQRRAARRAATQTNDNDDDDEYVEL